MEFAHNTAVMVDKYPVEFERPALATVGLSGVALPMELLPHISSANASEEIRAMRWLRLPGTETHLKGLVEIEQILPPEVFMKATVSDARAWFGM